MNWNIKQLLISMQQSLGELSELLIGQILLYTMQARVMQLMPIMFTLFFMIFPAGLVLYWTVNNLLSMAQQWIVNRQLQSAKSKG